MFLDPKRGLNPFDDQWRFLEASTRVLEQQLDEVIEVNELGPQPPARAPGGSLRPGSMIGVGGLPPCARRMLAEGVHANQRVACFRLAVQLRKAGLPEDTANRTPDDSRWRTAEALPQRRRASTLAR